MLKKLMLRFGLKGFAERRLASWWAMLEQFARERQDALLPGPIKGLAQFLLRSDTKVIGSGCQSSLCPLSDQPCFVLPTPTQSSKTNGGYL